MGNIVSMVFAYGFWVEIECAGVIFTYALHIQLKCVINFRARLAAVNLSTYSVVIVATATLNQRSCILYGNGLLYTI